MNEPENESAKPRPLKKIVADLMDREQERDRLIAEALELRAELGKALPNHRIVVTTSVWDQKQTKWIDTAFIVTRTDAGDPVLEAIPHIEA